MGRVGWWAEGEAALIMQRARFLSQLAGDLTEITHLSLAARPREGVGFARLATSCTNRLTHNYLNSAYFGPEAWKLGRRRRSREFVPFN